MRVLYLGTYERDYPRNAQVISCLRSAGAQVVEKHLPVWDGQRHKFSPGTRSLVRAVRAEFRLARMFAEDVDVLIVGYPGHLDVPAARHVARGRPVVFNPLVSLEDTMVGDRRLVSSWSPVAVATHLVDRIAFRGADLVVADTTSHATYFRERFDLAADRVAVCYVGAEDRLFTAGHRETSPFHVLFVGKLIPLQGLETILKAASFCPEIELRIVGSGQLDAMLTKLPPNVRWNPWVEYEHLPELYREAGCALGIFGVSDKASRVIPNKVFQALATETPVVTADTPGARELLEDGRDALLVPPGNAEALAVALRRLAVDADLRSRIGSQGRATYEQHASETALGRRWRTVLEELIARRQIPRV